MTRFRELNPVIAAMRIRILPFISIAMFVA
jgi:hypothetical protein